MSAHRPSPACVTVPRLAQLGESAGGLFLPSSQPRCFCLLQLVYFSVSFRISRIVHSISSSSPSSPLFSPLRSSLSSSSSLSSAGGLDLTSYVRPLLITHFAACSDELIYAHTATARSLTPISYISPHHRFSDFEQDCQFARLL